MPSTGHCGHGTSWPHHSHGCGPPHSPYRRWRSYTAPACFYDPHHYYHRHDWYLDDRDHASDHPYNYNDNYWTAAAAGAADYESDYVQPSAPAAAATAAEDISTSNKASGSRVELAVKATKQEDSNVNERIDRVVDIVEGLAAKVDEMAKKMEENNSKEK